MIPRYVPMFFLCATLTGCGSGNDDDAPNVAPTRNPPMEHDDIDARTVAIEYLKANGIDAAGWQVLSVEDSEKFRLTLREPLADGTFGKSIDVTIVKADGSISVP